MQINESKPFITDHVVVRYLELSDGINIDRIRAEIERRALLDPGFRIAIEADIRRRLVAEARRDEAGSENSDVR